MDYENLLSDGNIAIFTLKDEYFNILDRMIIVTSLQEKKLFFM